MHGLKRFWHLRCTLPHARNSVSNTFLASTIRYQNSFCPLGFYWPSRITLTLTATSVSSFYQRAPKDEAEESLLNALGMKDRTVRLTKDENGNEVVTTGGRITSYLRPGSGGLKDRLVDPRLVEDFGVYDINDLTEGQLADYFAAQEQAG